MGQTVVKKDSGASLLQRIGNRYGVDPAKVYETLCKTVFRDAKSQEQVIALLIVADQYKLNPFTREIYAFVDRKSGAVVPLVGIDGWLRIINDHPQFDGMEFSESDTTVAMEYQVEGPNHQEVTRQANPAPEWMECIIHRKDREHPTVVREYLTEVYRNTGPWNQTTARMLRHRCIMQCARVAFGFGGIVDPEDAERAAEFDFEGVALSEEIVKPIGKADYKKLVAQAKRCGYSEDDVIATAATAGFEGPGHEMPEDLAERISEGMKTSPREGEPPAADPETGEVIKATAIEEEPPHGGYRTPMVGDD